MCVSLEQLIARLKEYHMNLDAELKTTKFREKTSMKRRAPVTKWDAFTLEIAGLSKASIRELRERWKTLYGKEPSGHIGRSFLIRAISYRFQEKVFGGL